jgi:hypothetical protein
MRVRVRVRVKAGLRVCVLWAEPKLIRQSSVYKASAKLAY